MLCNEDAVRCLCRRREIFKYYYVDEFQASEFQIRSGFNITFWEKKSYVPISIRFLYMS